jgi:hypothetical protein
VADLPIIAWPVCRQALQPAGVQSRNLKPVTRIHIRQFRVSGGWVVALTSSLTGPAGYIECNQEPPMTAQEGRMLSTAPFLSRKTFR